MDPNFNEGWSSSEIDMVKSLITSHITNKTYTNDTNKKHNEFVDDLQAMFPWKEKHQVINLYVELVVEMTMAQSSNQHVVGSSALVNVVPKKRRHAVKFWTTYEHRNFLHGLEAFGSGEWNSISKYFVPTKTPVQISSHAQKYFHRQECTTRRQCFNTNNVSLCDTQPSMPEDQ
ncbi:hypothetical protein BDA96_09G042600 [Sorghum bicolor]|uniref:HTH myb-type domain-containing protein n=2 Tax=Sorghum bicolor TaxID=4558 RepID=A0A921Q864_SORBI|nr:hypothetical protein BDA96_09G042600 [Sorghum bicolor]KXG21281.1 hypothetical protein SORBI_3009G039900 [Sorghum bicolor]